ncbi:MAG: pyridoxamine 5'-phosphate oxidase family protein [candidate division WOR-3 bacterium]|nr:MAG: pyridoxamine 5'-phosphate oxidase family protein [candidate division WOR-3 bacterium]
MGGLEEVKKEVWSQFKDMQVIYLATAEGDLPRVRPVTLIHFDKKMWVTTGSGDNKIRQIKENDNIEFCMPVVAGENTGYVRCIGKAEIVKDKETRILIADNTPFFKQFWKDTNDPTYALLHIRPRDIEYLKPGSLKAERFSVA